MLGIVFTGASGVGKSTLASWAANHYGLPYLPSVTADVYKEAGTTFAEAFGNADQLREIQLGIHNRTFDQLADAVTVHRDGFVTDRGPDVLVYTAMMCHNAYPSRHWPEHITDFLKRPDVLTVFVRPCRSILERARASDEGRRKVFLSDEWVYRVDGGIAYHLETNCVPYVSIEGESHAGRRATVKRAADAIKLAGWRAEAEKPKKKR